MGLEGSGGFRGLGLKVVGVQYSRVSVWAEDLRLKLGGAFKAFEKILVNKILLSPKRENIKCSKALPSKGCRFLACDLR